MRPGLTLPLTRIGSSDLSTCSKAANALAKQATRTVPKVSSSEKTHMRPSPDLSGHSLYAETMPPTCTSSQSSFSWMSRVLSGAEALQVGLIAIERMARDVEAERLLLEGEPHLGRELVDVGVLQVRRLRRRRRRRRRREAAEQVALPALALARHLLRLFDRACRPPPASPRGCPADAANRTRPTSPAPRAPSCSRASDRCANRNRTRP